MTNGMVGLGDISADGDTLYWLESRPEEQGRSVLMRRHPDGSVQDMTPPPANVGSRVHEYGGGAYTVGAGRIVYSNKTDSTVWLIPTDGEARKIAATEGCRYADFRFVPGSDSVVCVREDHRDRPALDPEATIVLLNTASASQEGIVLTRGADFYASPRPSPDGQRLAFLSWHHPDMPWDATQLHIARLQPSGLTDIFAVAGTDEREAIVQPEWSPSGVLHFCTDRSGWWNIYRVAENGATEPVTMVPDGEIGGPLWNFGQRYFAFLPDGSIVAALSRGGRIQAVAVENGRGRDLALPPVQNCPVVLPGSLLAYVSAAADKPPALCLSRDTIRLSGQRTGLRFLLRTEERALHAANGRTAAADRHDPRRPDIDGAGGFFVVHPVVDDTRVCGRRRQLPGFHRLRAPVSTETRRQLGRDGCRGLRRGGSLSGGRGSGGPRTSCDQGRQCRGIHGARGPHGIGGVQGGRQSLRHRRFDVARQGNA
jgi:hypothetical protein